MLSNSSQDPPSFVEVFKRHIVDAYDSLGHGHFEEALVHLSWLREHRHLVLPAKLSENPTPRLELCRGNFSNLLMASMWVNVFCLERLDRVPDALCVCTEAIQLLKLRIDSDGLDRSSFYSKRIALRAILSEDENSRRRENIEDCSECILALQESEESRTALFVGTTVELVISNLFLFRGRQNRVLGNFAEALSDLSQSLLADPTNVRALAERAIMYSWIFSRWDLALTDFEEVFRNREIEIMEGVDADDLPNREMMCLCYEERGQFRFMMRDFEGAASDFYKMVYLCQPGNPITDNMYCSLLLFAFSRCFLGDFESASEMIDEWYQISPGCVCDQMAILDIVEFLPVLKSTKGVDTLKRVLVPWLTVDSPSYRADYVVIFMQDCQYPGLLRVSISTEILVIPSFVIV